MSIQAVAWALDQDLPARPKLVLVSIANHANHTDGYCWLKAETIAAESACTTRSIYRFIGGLVRNGYIRKAPRKGDDGKQRANDYWILFNRPAGTWDWGAKPDGDAGDDDGEHPQDIAEPYDRISHGESDAPIAPEGGEVHAVSHGPSDSGVSRYMDEPSKSNPSQREDARARPERALPPSHPRQYRPPPPEPMGAVIADRDAKQIFVFEGSRAYRAWVEHKKRSTGIDWSLTTVQVIDGQAKRGWWFPSLFPPGEPAPADSPSTTDPPAQAGELMTGEDRQFLEKHGLR